MRTEHIERKVAETNVSLSRLVTAMDENLSELVRSVTDTANNKDMIPVKVFGYLVGFLILFNFALIFGLQVAGGAIREHLTEIAKAAALTEGEKDGVLR